MKKTIGNNMVKQLSAEMKKIIKRLPDDKVIEDETNFELTKDEYVGILSWIKYFNRHYRKYGKEKLPDIKVAVVSSRIHLKLDLYNKEYNAKYIIYISENAVKSFDSICSVYGL